MKKLFALLLAFTLVLSLSACSDNEGTVSISGEGEISTSYYEEENERILSAPHSRRRNRYAVNNLFCRLPYDEGQKRGYRF